MISESEFLDLPANVPIQPDLSEHIQVLARAERLCNDILDPQARIFRRRSNRAQKKVVRNFLWENDVNPKDANGITKLLSLDIIQKGYEEINLMTIRKGFNLAKYYTEQTKEFDPRYFREILDSARSFFARLAEDDEVHGLIKKDITIMIDILLGEAQKIIEPKEELTQKESYFYRLAGDFTILFLDHEGASRDAYDYYETGIQRGNINCYVPFCRLLEESGHIDNAIVIAENGWNVFQNRPCLEEYIRLLYKKGDEHSVGMAGIAYQKYMVLFPDDYKPIQEFRYQFNLIDLPTLDNDLIKIHAKGSGGVFEKELLDGTSTVIMGVLSRNAKVLVALAERLDLLDNKAGNMEYQEILTEQLILLQRGVFDFLDSQFLSMYLGYLMDISEEDLGYNFLVDFFEYHGVSHVEVIADMSARESSAEYEDMVDMSAQEDTAEDEGMVEMLAQEDGGVEGVLEEDALEENTTEEDDEGDTLAQKLFYHFTFIIYHYTFTDDSFMDEILAIAKNLRMQPEMIEELVYASEDMQELRENLDTLPENLIVQFLSLRTVLLERYGEMFVRKMEHTIFKRFGLIQAGRMDIEARIYAFSLGCISGNHAARENAMETINALGINKEQAKYIGQMLREITLYTEAIEILVGYADLEDVDVLEYICQIGITAPEIVPVIQTDFTQRLDEMEYEVVQIKYFLERMEEDARQGSDENASLPRIQRILAMSYWMEGKNTLNIFEGKNNLDAIEDARKHFEKALGFFELSLEGTVQKLQENPTSKEVRKEYHDIAKWFGEFIMQHSHNQLQGYGLLLNVFEQYHDMTILQLLARIAINLDLRDEAHKWITLMDEEDDPDATELWLEYYFTGTSLSDKMTAVYKLMATEPEAVSFIDEDLVTAIQGYAEQQLGWFTQKTNKTDEEETHLLHLERCYAIVFNVDIAKAREYWKKLGQMIREGQIERLNEHFVLYVEPDTHVNISQKLPREKKDAQHLLTNLLEELYIFRNIFKMDEHFILLSYDMKEAFQDLPDNLGVGFIEEIISQAKTAEYKRLEEDMKAKIVAQEELRLRPTVH